MKMKTVFVFIALVCQVFVSSAYAGLIEESVALDRSYVPALALTNQRDKPAALVQESIRRFARAWERFVHNIGGTEATKPILRDAIARSSNKTREAGVLAAEDRRKEAHEALETVRMDFWKARVDMGLTYLPDLFTAFHEPMEVFAELAVKPETDPATLREKLRELSDLWKSVEAVRLDTQLFGVGPERAARYNELVSKEREILTRLEGLIGSADREAFVKGATAMKGNFAQAYFVFGDFSGLQ